MATIAHWGIVGYTSAMLLISADLTHHEHFPAQELLPNARPNGFDGIEMI